jgi:hypothetical protein
MDVIKLATGLMATLAARRQGRFSARGFDLALGW